MSHNGNYLYLFGDFSFNAEKRVLRRGEKPVPLTPKTLELLRVLIKNHGQIVEKEELMSEVWADSFVEDSNLTFTVRQLRKALADSAHEPAYIETVPRRGYRFIAEVRKAADDNALKNGDERTFSPPIQRNPAGSPAFTKFFVPAAAVLIVSLITAGFWYAGSKTSEADAPVLHASFASEKLSTNGKVYHAVISPDGKNVVYTNGLAPDKMSVWLRQLKSANTVEIIPPSEDVYGGLAFSPDGNFLYFARRPKSVEGQYDIYRVSIFGGLPKKIAGETQGWISVAPDGEKISFVRCYYREDENCSLWIADALDGKNERKLAARPRPFRIGDNEFSLDGKTVAFAAGQSENQANEFGLNEVDVESGAERELTAQKFFNIKALAWLPNQSDLLITASKIPNSNFRIWRVSSATGAVEPLTKDSETYSVLSLDKEANAVVSTQIKADFRLRLWNAENPSAAPRVLADAMTLAFAPNGKIVFTSRMTGNNEIWSINADGSGQRQLTNDAADDVKPLPASDGNSIFFASNRTGEVHIWRMNADGSSPAQITQKEGGFPLFASLDGKWLYYHTGRQRTLRRVSTADGEEQSVFDKRKYRFAHSPDGSQIAFPEKQGEETILTVASLTDGRTIKTFRPADVKARFFEVVWTPDGKNLAYILTNKNSGNNNLWLQPLDEETPLRQIADFGDEEISEMSGFAISPDERSFAVAQGGWRHDAVILKGLK